MLEIQKYLLSFKEQDIALKNLRIDFGIESYVYKDDLVILQYSHTHSPKNHIIADDCRGIILSADFTKVLCRPFSRFYNYGERQSDKKLSLDTCDIFEKVDGTLLSLWYHDIKKKWFFSTKKRAYAEGYVNQTNITFSQIAEKFLGNNVCEVFKNLEDSHKDITWIFEITSPESRVIKNYEETDIFLIGLRNRITGEYYDILDYIKIIQKYSSKIKLPQIYSFNNFKEMQNDLKKKDNLDEGYVCFNKITQERFKIKSPLYVAKAYQRSNLYTSRKVLLKMIFDNEFEEYLTYFPEDSSFLLPFVAIYEKMKKEIFEIFNLYKNVKNRKEFVNIIKDLPYKDILYKMYDGDSFDKIIKNTTFDYKEKMMNYFEKT